jgi:hypothetical protein
MFARARTVLYELFDDLNKITVQISRKETAQKIQNHPLNFRIQIPKIGKSKKISISKVNITKMEVFRVKATGNLTSLPRFSTKILVVVVGVVIFRVVEEVFKVVDEVEEVSHTNFTRTTTVSTGRSTIINLFNNLFNHLHLHTLIHNNFSKIRCQITWQHI